MINQPGITAYAKLFKGDTEDRFGVIAIGSGSTAEAASDTQLVSEHTASGAGRVAATVAIAGTNNERLRFTAAFMLSGNVTIRECNVTNDQSPLTANTGDQLMRIVFASDFMAAAGDNLALEMEVVGSDASSAGSGYTSSVTYEGIEQSHKLAGAGLSTANGVLTTLAIGTGTTAPAITDTGLQTEILSTDNLSLGRNEETSRTISLQSTNGFTDTVRITQGWTIGATGSANVREVSMETHLTAGSGVTPMRVVLDNAVPMNSLYGDSLTMTCDLVLSIAP